MRFILSLSGDRRRRLLQHLQYLKARWHEEPDFHEPSHCGRRLSVKALRPFLVSYWIDGPVNELRVVDVQIIRT